MAARDLVVHLFWLRWSRNYFQSWARPAHCPAQPTATVSGDAYDCGPVRVADLACQLDHRPPAERLASGPTGWATGDCF